MKVATHQGFDIIHLSTPGEMAEARAEFIGAYQTIFAQAPYYERYSPAEADGRFRKLTSTPDNITLIARQDGYLAGFAIAVPLRTQKVLATMLTGLVPVPHTYYLAELGVLEQHRRHGLGRILVRERLRMMDQELYSHVVLRVSATRNASYQMYRDMGFDDMGVYQEVRTPRIDGQVKSDRRLFLSRMLSQI
ncbi:MAG: GNAT family N-acetyltransferase [Deltaproteobacteria bacterium]|nr:MAG: GNAT family N-acetyltransferase [Deltaproteobacteria bacterium]